MIIGNGQINMNSKFGTCIFNICSDNTIRNIIEVGTWNGQGSTTCVMNGILKRSNSTLYSIEANSNMYNRAINFWKKYDTKKNLVLINGTLHNKIADLNELNILYNNNIPYYNEHYVSEKQMIEKSSKKLSATLEMLSLYIDLSKRKVSEFEKEKVKYFEWRYWSHYKF